MRVLVTRVYDGGQDVFDGQTPQDIYSQIITHFPFLHSEDPEHEGDLDSLLEHINSMQAFDAHIEGEEDIEDSDEGDFETSLPLDTNGDLSQIKAGHIDRGTLTFLSNAPFHPHDDEVWFEDSSLNKFEGFEKLIKGKKDGLKMYGATPTPEQKAHVDWSYSKLPNENWATWSIRNHKQNPDQFTSDVKQEIEHFAGSQHIPDIGNVRFDKEHDLDTGLNLLRTAENNYNDKFKNKLKLVKRPKTAQKLLDLGDGLAWWSLGKRSCTDEGWSMGHCGNWGSPKEGDNVISLRSEHVVGGRRYFEPHVTFIENDGAFGEMKGRANEKPAKHYHRAIAELFKKTGYAALGGGYKPQNNFNSNDFSPELYEEVKAANPNIAFDKEGELPPVSILGHSNKEISQKAVKKVLESPSIPLDWQHKLVGQFDDDFASSPLPGGMAQQFAKRGDLAPEVFKSLMNNSELWEPLATNPNLPSNLHARLASVNNVAVKIRLSSRSDLSPDAIEALVKHNGYYRKTIRENLAKYSKLPPELFNTFAENPDFAEYLAQNPHLPPNLHFKVASHKNTSANYHLGKREDLHPDVFESFAKDPGQSRQIASNGRLPKHLFQKFSSNPELAGLLARNPNLPQELHGAVAAHNDDDANEQLFLRGDIHLETLKNLAKKPELKPFLAQRAKLTPQAQLELAKLNDVGINQFLSAREDLQPEALKVLAQNPDVAHTLARNPSITPELQLELYKHEKNNIAIASELAKRRDLHPDLFEKFVQDPDLHPNVFVKLAQNDNLPNHLHSKLAEKNDFGLGGLKSLAMREDLHPDAFRKLAQNPDPGIVYNLADNPNLPQELQLQIAAHGHHEANQRLTLRPDLHPDLFEKFVQDPRLFLFLAKNPNLPKHLQPAIASTLNLNTPEGRDRDVVAVKLAKRKDLIPELFHKFADDKLLAGKIAEHPNLPPELQKKIASYNDVFIRRNLAKRDDLTKDAFGVLAEDPWVAEELAENRDLPVELYKKILSHNNTTAAFHIARKHNATKEILYSILANREYHRISDVVKSRLQEIENKEEDDIVKMSRPTFKFPKLGMPDDRRETPIINTQSELETKARAIANTQTAKLGTPKDEYEQWKKNRVRQDVIRESKAANGFAVVGAKGNTISYSKSNQLRESGLTQMPEWYRTLILSQQAPVATKLHEDLHLMFDRVHKKYGAQARVNLAVNMLEDLASKNKPAWEAAQKYLDARTANTLKDNPIEPEELIAHSLNYLNNPGEREAYHRGQAHLPREVRRMDAHMKYIYNHLKNIAQNADESWLVAPAVRRQAAPQSTAAEATNKSEAPLEAILAPNLEHSDRIEAGIRVATAMLGLRTSSHEAFEAAKFLAGGKSLSFDQIRRAIHNNDGDLEAAALQAYGLENNESNKKAIRAVIKTKGLQKSIDNPIRFKEIESAVSEGHDAADSVKRASELGHIHKIILHGKHSQGSMLAFDPENDVTLLLKPDFGGAGPASGAQEESASPPRREAAFWHVANEWGLSKWVPQTDLLLLDGKEFAAIHVLPWSWQTIEKMREENPAQVSSILNKYLKSGTLHKWAVLDFVLGNTDRHGQNAMGDIEGGELALIDHGSAMAGPSFDPAHDKNSFVPFYLRFLTPGNFNSLTVSDKLKRMPHVDNGTDEELVHWVVSLDAHELEEILYRYGIDSHPALQRLTVLREMVGETGRLDQSINRLWVTT